MAIDGKSLGTSFGINAGVCAVAFLIFSFLRTKPFTRKFYAPKRYDHEVVRKPRKLPDGLLSWLGPVMTYPEDEILTTVGMDVVVMTRLLTYGWVLFAFATFWCCALLMPINGTAGFLPSPAGASVKSWSDLDLISSSNVPPRDHRFWAHLGSVYVISAVALTLLLAFSKDVSRLRARYISMQPRGGPSHCVLVTDIPCIDGKGAKATPPGPLAKIAGLLDRKTPAEPEPFASKDAAKAGSVSGHHGYPPVADDVLDPWADTRTHLASGNVDSMVRREMEATYGASHIAAVNVVSDTRKTDPLLAKYDATLRQLDDLNNDYIGKIKAKKDVKRKQVSLLPALTPKWAKERYNVGTKAVKVDALEYLPLQLDHQLKELHAEREAVGGERLPAAFVTFNDRFTANAAATGLHSYDETAWRMQPAPDSSEVLWSNLPMRYSQRVSRSLAMGALFVAILIFYIPVTAAIQAVVNLDNARKIPGLAPIVNIPFVTQILQGILPSLVLKIFLILLPPILAAMARFEGKISVSQIDFAVVSRFFTFQVFATFLYQFLVGTALSNVQALVSKPPTPGDVIGILGVSAAQMSTFFMTYIMINACGVGMALLRVVPLVLFFVFSKLAGTERAKYRLWAKQPFQFGTAVANHTIILLLGLAYCCLAPLITGFAFLYFTLALLAQKYQLIYVVTLPYDAAGRMWKTVFHQIMTGIYFLQLMVLAVLCVKSFPYALLVLPLLLFTVVFHIVQSRLFARPWGLMNLREAALLDARDHAPVTPAEAEAVRARYLSPVYKVDEAEHARLIDEAAQVDKHLKGEVSSLKLDDEAEVAGSAV